MGSHPERLVYWHPDFQDKYMPEYFSQREIEERDLGMHLMATRKIPIVFSSYTCERDYRKFYPENQNKSFVVHFAVDHSNFVNVNIATVKKKYGIVGDYLLCANQFWKHKNHLFLFKAYHKALQKGLNVQLICTGELTDYRNPDYIEEIKRFIHVNNLTDCIKILGLIDGNDLHCLMKHSYAVVQPSLFEGWNTTVEDCKAINKFIFISDIPVHREQVESNVCFFNPHDEKDLAMKLLTVNPTNEIYDYSKKMQEFGLSFLNVINYMENLQCERQQEQALV